MKATSLNKSPQLAAFTLVELLVTVAIIAILAAMLVPALSYARNQSISTSCRTRLGQLGVALNMYASDNSETYPYYVGSPGPSYGDAITARGGLVYWSTKLFPYCHLNWTNFLFHCPGYKGTNAAQFNPKSFDRYGSYAYNEFGAVAGGRLEPYLGMGPAISWSVPPVKVNNVVSPSDLVAITESKYWSATPVKVGPVNFGPRPGGVDWVRCGLDFPFDLTRHGGKYNVVFCDAHVASIFPGRLFNPTNSASKWNSDHQPHPELW